MSEEFIPTWDLIEGSSLENLVEHFKNEHISAIEKARSERDIVAYYNELVMLSACLDQKGPILEMLLRGQNPKEYMEDALRAQAENIVEQMGLDPSKIAGIVRIERNDAPSEN